ncbi:MAG: hydrolase protein [Dehalococcoidia bacterium]|nr:hydrolase protein [Dehalococcoidia bacterium]
MKIGFYNDFRPCILKDNGVVDITSAVSGLQGGSPQLTLENIIINWQFLRPRLDQLQEDGTVIPMSSVRLRVPVPRPGKVLCGRGNFMEGVKITPMRPMQTFFKSPDAVIGPGDTVVLPSFRPVIFNHEAELVIVMGQTAKNVTEAEALDHVFGYTAGVDVSARAPSEGESELPGQYGKCFDTFLPLGPAITTADEIKDPNTLQIRYWVNGKLRQNYNTSDMEHTVAYMVASLSHVMSLKPGDIIMAGTNHGNLGPLQDGDVGEIEIDKIGRSAHNVVDALKRTWDPEVVRNPRTNAERREALKGLPNPGTWPFTPISGPAK